MHWMTDCSIPCSLQSFVLVVPADRNGKLDPIVTVGMKRKPVLKQQVSVAFGSVRRENFISSEERVVGNQQHLAVGKIHRCNFRVLHCSDIVVQNVKAGNDDSVSGAPAPLLVAYRGGPSSGEDDDVAAWWDGQ